MVLGNFVLWYFWYKAGIAIITLFQVQRSPLINQNVDLSEILMIKFVFIYLFGRVYRVNSHLGYDGAPSYLYELWMKSFCDQNLNLLLDFWFIYNIILALN